MADRPRKLTLHRRGKVWWVAARDPKARVVRAMSMRSGNPAIAADRQAQLTAVCRCVRQDSGSP